MYRVGESRRTTILYATLSRIGQLRDSGELIFTSNVTRMLRSASPAPCVRMCVLLDRRWRRETLDCARLSTDGRKQDNLRDTRTYAPISTPGDFVYFEHYKEAHGFIEAIAKK